MKKIFAILFLLSSILVAEDSSISNQNGEPISKINNIIYPIAPSSKFENLSENMPYCQAGFSTGIESTVPRCRRYSNSYCGNGGVCYSGMSIECEVCFTPKDGFYCQNIGG